MLIPLIVAVAVVFYIISVYNSLQTLRTQIAASIQEIGNQLKRQAALIPILEAATKGYLKHEKGVDELSICQNFRYETNSSGKPADIEGY
jgi:hypothetical protein